MIELLLAVAVLMTGLLGFSRSLVEISEIEKHNEESALAVAAARQIAERMYGTTFSEVFAAFNGTAADDGLVTGTAWGGDFEIEGLAALLGDPDGASGEIRLPVVDVGGGVLELREDVVDAELGMPRDLNLDGLIDGLDHSGDYRVLPALIRVDWVSGKREESMEVLTLLGAR